MSTVVTFLERFPEFFESDPLRIQYHLDQAAIDMSISRWGVLYDRGQDNYAAHYLWLEENKAGKSNAGGNVGPLSSKKVGDVAYTFATSSEGTVGMAGFDKTDYGLEYYRLMRRVGMGALVV